MMELARWETALQVLHMTVLLLAVAAVLPLKATTAGAAGREGVSTPQVTNDKVSVVAVGDKGDYVGFDVVAPAQEGAKTAATVRFSSGGLLTADQCSLQKDGKSGQSLVFTGLVARPETGLELGERDRIAVELRDGDPYPRVSFDLTIVAFDPAKWQATVGRQPFHFLAIYMSDAEAWHTRGWLNATPVSDPFPLLLDPHAGTPEISAYHYNRNWSYTVPLGAQPIPVIGLWAPRSKHYVGLEFQTTRMDDNSEKDIATGYCWGDGTVQPGKANSDQFVSLVYPYGGTGYQDLVFPEAGSKIASNGTLIWSLDMPATDDPNRFFYSYLWSRAKDRLPRVPAVVDLSWVPGGIKLNDFQGAPDFRQLIGGPEKPFEVDGTQLIYGWGWHNESPTAVRKKTEGDASLAQMKEVASTLMKYAKYFTIDGDQCVYWGKPLIGQWVPEWGGKEATSLHNANGFAAGRLLLGLYCDYEMEEYLPVVDGVLNWAKHVAWTRNEFADVPSSPFAIGGTLSASFCLEYYMTFKDAPDQLHRDRAREALDLAHSFTYRYLTMWPSDNNRADNLDSTFLWEPNSGRDWTGAACSNEVFWNLDTLAQVAVHTGDPVLMWALAGSLDRWPVLYQEKYRDSLDEYISSDMTEGYGLYPGNVYGVGSRASYGFSAPLNMTEPVGMSVVRVLAGEKAAMAFSKFGIRTSISDYRYTAPGNLSFTVHSSCTNFSFALSLTVPYVDISDKKVALVRNGESMALEPGLNYVRPSQALWSLMLRDVRDGDTIIVGEPDEKAPALPVGPPLVQRSDVSSSGRQPGFFIDVPLPFDTVPDENWINLDSWAGLPRDTMWYYGVPLILAPRGSKSVVTKQVSLEQPVRGAAYLALLYSAGDGPAPAALTADGGKVAIDSELTALAWRAWPPIYTSRLLISMIPVSGEEVVGIDPGDRIVWAATAIRGDGASESSKVLTSSQSQSGRDQLREILSALREANSDLGRLEAEEKLIAGLRGRAEQMPRGSIAILPPDPGGPALSMAWRAGLRGAMEMLRPEQIVDPDYFNAKRFPVAVYSGGEKYIDTVHAQGDGAEAILRYVREGGTLLLLSPGPWPMFYPNIPSTRPNGSMTAALGLPLFNSIETRPEDTLTMVLHEGQQVLHGLPGSFPYPPGDPRLRSVDRSRLPKGAKYTPIYTVIGEKRKDYGDAGALVELPGGKGRILYLWGGLLRDPDNGIAVTLAALNYLVDLAAGGKE